MKQIALVLVLAFLHSSSCHSRHEEIVNNIKVPSETRYFKSVKLIDDSSYIFTLRTIDTTNSFDIEKPTTIANLLHLSREKLDTLKSDSIFSRNHPDADPELAIEFQDFNIDGVNDIILPAGSDPRSNKGFHLYIVDKKNKQLHYVNGFQLIGNPEPKSTNQLISSFILSGQNYLQFFFIHKDNTLKKLRTSVNSEYDDQYSIRFQNALNAAVRERKKHF